MPACDADRVDTLSYIHLYLGWQTYLARLPNHYLSASMINGSLPLVFCIMPTFDRRDFVPRAITYFQRQDYPNKQLIIVDDGNGPEADLIPPGTRSIYPPPHDLRSAPA